MILKTVLENLFSKVHTKEEALVAILKKCCKQSFGEKQPFIMPGVAAGDMKPTHITEKVGPLNTEWRV